MGNEKFKNFFLILILILVIIGIPYFLYTLGAFIEIDYFGHLNNWWLVLFFILILIAVFVLGGIDIEKNMGYFFLLFFTIPFFILGIRLGDKPTLDLESYTLLLGKEQEIDRLDSIRLKLENDLAQIEDEHLEEQAPQSHAFKNHEIIFFDSGSARLSSFNKRKITAFIYTLENCILNVYGHTDGLGSKISNMDISIKRAQNVADFIKSIEQQSNIINTVDGFGADYQLVKNSNETFRSINRRVTIEIVGKYNEDAKALRKKIQDKINKNRRDIKNIKVERDSFRKIIYQNIEE